MRCPHCRVELPEASTFCAACGRRIEGWRGEVKAAKSGPLPGGEEPTTNMQPTPSLLRAAALSKKTPEKPPTTDGAMEAVKVRRWPLWLALALVAASAGVVAYRMAKKPVEAEAAVKLPEIGPGVPTETPTAVAPPPPATVKAKSRKPRRIEPVAVNEPKAGGGALPHKKVATDSKSMAPASQAPVEELPTEAAPLTEEEQKRQAEASVDADGVRFVVRAHMNQVRSCSERAFKGEPQKGRVEIGFVLDKNGRAQRVRTELNTTDSETLAKCLEGRVKEWEFPRPVGGEVELIYPFVFSSAM